MEPNVYQQNVNRTMLRHEDHPFSMEDPVCIAQLNSYGLGIAGEAGEVADLACGVLDFGSILVPQREKIVKEVGDVYWYMAALCSVINMPFQNCFSIQRPPQFHAVTQFAYSVFKFNSAAASVADYLKKTLHHRHPMNTLYLYELIGVVRGWGVEVRRLANISEAECFEANIEKLRKRYPDGFNTQDSIERKDVTA